MDDRVLLFDLGGVLIKLRIAQSVQSMTGGSISWEEIKTMLIGDPVIRAFECGQSTPEEFAENFIRKLNLTLSAPAFIEELATWPVGFFDGAQELLAKLRKNYSINCFSNTNEVHWQQAWVDEFDHAIASHLIGLAKPDLASFKAVIKILDTPARSIWFFDDTLSNVAAAKELGINAYHTDGFDALTATLTQLGFIQPAQGH